METETISLQTFFKISSTFHSRKKVKQVWNDMMGSNYNFGVDYPFNVAILVV